jgi:hypothetical protein
MQACGRKYFIGSLWMAIMRCERGKAQGILYLKRIIPKYKMQGIKSTSSLSYDDEEEEEEEILE